MFVKYKAASSSHKHKHFYRLSASFTLVKNLLVKNSSRNNPVCLIVKGGLRGPKVLRVVKGYHQILSRGSRVNMLGKFRSTLVEVAHAHGWSRLSWKVKDRLEQVF